MYKEVSQEEMQKCKDNPYYYFTTYITINGEPATTNLTEEQFNKQFRELTGSKRRRIEKILKGKQPTRKFYGKTKDFKDHYEKDKDGNEVLVRTAKEEEAFEKAHLKTYLKGATQFKFGEYRDAFGTRRPYMFAVATEPYNQENEEEKKDTIQEDNNTNI